MQLLVELSTKRRSRKKEKGKKGMKEVRGKEGNTKSFAVQSEGPLRNNWIKVTKTTI